MKTQWRLLATAIMFLTRIPVGSAGSGDPDDLAASTQYFPLVGIIIGLAVGVVFWLTQLVWSNELAVILCMVFAVLITGGFHEDGLADAADSTGAWTKERKLEVMRDSRNGTYGGLALIFALLLTGFALIDIANQSLTNGSTLETVVMSLIVAHVLGRWSSLILIHTTQYAREDAANKVFVDGVNRHRVIIGTLVTMAALVISCAVSVPSTLAAFLVTLLIIALSRRWFMKSIGGITGDCLGAANKIVEVSVYLSFAALIS